MSLALSILGRYWPALAILVLVIGAYQAGANAERKRGEAANLRAQIATLQRDRDIANRSLARVANDNAELEAAAKQDEVRINALTETIKGRPADAGRGLTQSELDSLLGIK